MKAFILTLLLTACAACPSTPNAAPTSPGDASTAPLGSDVCAQACGVLRAQGCPEGATLDGGESCEVVCRHSQQGAFDMKPSCLATKISAEGIRSCGSVACNIPIPVAHPSH
jgi:hypothetical protein